MSEQYLIDALDDSLNRLQAGERIEDCLRDYPEIADELGALLRTGEAINLDVAPVDEVASMHTRLDPEISNLIDTVSFAWYTGFLGSLGPMLTLGVTIAAIVGGFFLLTVPEDSDPEVILTPEPSPVVITETPTNTVEPSPTIVTTVTDIASPTATPSPTATATPTVTASATDTGTPAACQPRDDWEIYTIRGGDTLSSIAARAGISLSEIREGNCLEDSSLIIAGQTLLVPIQLEEIGSTQAPDNSSSGSTRNDDDSDDDDDDDDSDDDDDDDD